MELQMTQIRIEESPADDQPEQDYYKEHRGPILQVRGPRANMQLTFVANDDDDIFEDQKFVEEVFETFCSTTKGKVRRYITLKNEGTTAIRYQWMSCSPSVESEYLLANPAGSVVPGGYMSDLPKHNLRKRQCDEKVFKSPSMEFRYRKLPAVLLAGQVLEFPIIFRSMTPGYFYETLYLVTHPKLKDAEGRGYSCRLTGICMDPDLLETGRNNTRPENIKELFKQTAIEKEASDLLDSILDRVLFVEPLNPSNLNIRYC